MTDYSTHIKTSLIAFFAFLIWTKDGNTQSKIYEFNGFFNGMNLTVQCRDGVTKPWHECDCFDSVAVNGKVYPNILYEGYQIDINNKLDLDMYQSVKVQIYYPERCDFRILNPNDFMPKEILPVKTFEFENDSTLKWTVSQVYPDLKLWVQIEQFKWDRWVKIDQNFNITDSIPVTFNVSKYIHPGENQFRAVVATINGQSAYSDPITSKKFKQKKVKLQYNPTDKILTFSSFVSYEIYDSNELIFKRGNGSSVDLHNLPPGTYRVFYSNRRKEILVK
ncbi:hypothetical protein K6119_15370 [Paracrocinitomix mangrovi]|uniref:hypothetical protein n=1 Tax=Paracrocinitomix mangrovi TaxID=2862509 RepID=UPI001C8ECDCA|nr:hypothetical protein [Paracrocinitomix mangrovi]UKN01108.1 hypothetical protein K6119_15370 [Paracrocinitomix mangrovi]